MAETFEPLASTTLGSDATSITLSSISSAYTDLRIVALVRSDRASVIDSFGIQFNSDSGTNYSDTQLYTDGAGSVLASRDTSATYILSGAIPGSTAPADAFATSIFDLFGYSGSTNKSVLINNAFISNSSWRRTQRFIGLWRNTAAINSIKIIPAFGTNLVAGSSLTIYGIKAA